MAWQKGQSGNPKGKRTGTRDAITQAFLNDLEKHWRENGEAALTAALLKEPAAYVKVVASLLPKDVKIEVEHSFVDALRELERIRREGLAAVGTSVAEESEQPAAVRH